MSEVDPTQRLAVYGSLAPGRANHHHLSGLSGIWSEGIVRGRLKDDGWGAGLGFPGLVPDPGGEAVHVQLLSSPDLREHWPRLDAFEGEGYVRLTIPVETSDGVVEAWIYALADAGDP